MKTFKTDKGEGIAIVVPNDQGDDLEIIRDQDDYHRTYLKYPSDKLGGLQNYECVNLPEGNWSLVCEIGKDGKVVGDASVVVESVDYDENHKLYRDYIKMQWTPTVSNSLISLLNSQGIYLENPEGSFRSWCGPLLCFAECVSCVEKREKWQKAEESTLKEGEKIVVLIKQPTQ